MTPYYQDDYATIWHGDCREILPTLPKVDLVCTDPPYGIGAARNERGGKRHGKAMVASTDYGASDWDDATADADVMRALLGKSTRMVIWGGNYYADVLPPMAGWLVWDKLTGENGYADAELAWTDFNAAVRLKQHLWKGMLRKGKEERHHPTQKPLEIMSWCIEQADKHGDNNTILDPFMGSGTTLRAAKDLQRKAIGIEIEEKYCEIAAQRLAQEVFALGA